METKEYTSFVKSENPSWMSWSDKYPRNNLVIYELSVITYFTTQSNTEYFVWVIHEAGKCEKNWKNLYGTFVH